jgi:hypothetical protein
LASFAGDVFSTFDAMVLTLTEVDSSVGGIYDGMINHLMSYDNCLHQNILLGPEVQKV